MLGIESDDMGLIVLVGVICLCILLGKLITAWRDIKVAKHTGTDAEIERQKTDQQFWKGRS